MHRSRKLIMMIGMTVALAVAAAGCRGCGRKARPAPSAQDDSTESTESAGAPQRDPDELLVRLRPETAARGVRIDKAVRSREAGVPAVRLDLMFERSYRGTVWVFALDQRGLELGRARVAIEAEAGSRSVVFLLDRTVKLEAVVKVEVAG